MASGLTPEKESLVIVMAGKSGVGKSTFINNFLQLKSDPAAAQLSPFSVTKDLRWFESEVNGVSLRVVDVPGLCSSDKSVNDKSILEELIKLTGGKIDILFFCISLITRIDSVDLEIIDLLSHTYGQDIWKRSIFLFTWADIVLLNNNNCYSDLNQLVHEFIQKLDDDLVKCDKRRMSITFRSISSLSKSEKACFNGIVCIPVSKDPDTPQGWREDVRIQVVRTSISKEKMQWMIKMLYGIDWMEVISTAACGLSVLLQNNKYGKLVAMGSITLSAIIALYKQLPDKNKN